MIKWFSRRREMLALREERRTLVDTLRQIEWRLAMCRNTGIDVHAAHDLAIGALRSRGGIAPDSATHYQRAVNRDERLLRAVFHPANAGRRVGEVLAATTGEPA